MQVFSHFPDDQKLFGFNYTSPELNDIEHTHEYDELVIVDKGCGLHIFNGELHFIQEGDLFLVKETDRHFYSELGTLSLMSVYINTKYQFHYLTNIYQILNTIYVPNQKMLSWLMPKDKEATLYLIRQLDNINQNANTEIRQIQSELIMMQLLNTIASRKESRQRSHTQYKVRQVLLYLQENFHNEINWQELADKFFITYKTMTQKIKELTGMTTVNYLNRLRVLSARDKILHTDDSITEISGLVGFNNSEYFSKCYKRNFGISPSEERK